MNKLTLNEPAKSRSGRIIFCRCRFYPRHSLDYFAQICKLYKYVLNHPMKSLVFYWQVTVLPKYAIIKTIQLVNSCVSGTKRRRRTWWASLTDTIQERLPRTQSYLHRRLISWLITNAKSQAYNKVSVVKQTWHQSNMSAYKTLEIIRFDMQHTTDMMQFSIAFVIIN